MTFILVCQTDLDDVKIKCSYSHLCGADPTELQASFKPPFCLRDFLETLRKSLNFILALGNLRLLRSFSE